MKVASQYLMNHCSSGRSRIEVTLVSLDFVVVSIRFNENRVVKPLKPKTNFETCFRFTCGEDRFDHPVMLDLLLEVVARPAGKSRNQISVQAVILIIDPTTSDSYINVELCATAL